MSNTAQIKHLHGAIGFGLRGEIKVDVMQGGRIVHEGKWQPNLILDRGLDIIATIPICDYFKICSKGTGTSITVETPAGSNHYSQAGPDLTVTRTAGARNFTSADVGKLIKFLDSPPVYGKVTAYTDATHVEVDRENTFTNVAASLYDVEQDWNDATESGMTVITNTLTKALGDDVVSVDGSPGTVFASGDVGKALFFNTSEAAFKITAFINADSVRVAIVGAPQGDQTISSETAARYIPIAGDANLLPTSRSGSYSIVNGENITYTGPTTSSGDIPDLSKWQKQFKRTFIFPAETGLDATNTYTEIMLSNVAYPGNNFNVRVKLSSGVDVLGPTTGGNPGQQLKVTYKMTLSSTPHAAVTHVDLSGITTENSGTMSGNKFADHAIERFATSIVAGNGDTDASATAMEPYDPATAAVSKDVTALAPYTNLARSNGVATTPMLADVYTLGSFTNTYVGTFGLNAAIGAYRCFMLYDADASMGVHTYLFDAAQTKDGNHVLRLTFSKTWDRDLG